jgi:hypothetical protein
MPKQNTHELKHIIDADGQEVIGVLIRNANKFAWLHKSDYERIIAQYGVCAWTMLHNGQGKDYVYIRTSDPKKRHLYITRLIAGDIQGMSVRFKDGNSLNLRQSNLYHDAGRGGEPLRKRFKLHIPGGGHTGLRIPVTEEGMA